jgi:uncharacterized protein (DUF736 family)
LSKFVIRFTNNIELTYKLIDHEIVDLWKPLISEETIDNLCPFNHYIGYASESIIMDKIHRLYELADLINSHAPNRVIKQEITKDTYQHAINTMHVHFPDLKNDENYKQIWKELSEYNDLIHWLESTLGSMWNRRNQSESSLFRITLDFNKTTKKFVQIPESAYKLFTPYLGFGDLLIHYTHVGRHAQELFMAQDLVCPKDQFVPQDIFTPSIRMYFMDSFYDTDLKKQNLRERWEKFYQQRGGKDFFEYDIDDPKIRFGYIKIGQLETEINNINEFRKILVDTKVVDWEIKEGQ